MNLRSEIDTIFEGKAFLRPLFYSYPGGLRFELSEGGSSIEQFLIALRKATEICADIFASDEPLAVCLRVRSRANRFAHRDLIAELYEAGITIPRPRSLWLEPVLLKDRLEEEAEEWWLNVAFQTPLSLLQNFLWCAFASDFGSIRPRTQCYVYLFSLNGRIMVWPYDDRGMDVVGPNHVLLTRLYSKHQRYLLEHDRETMVATFEPSNPSLKPAALGRPGSAARL